MTIINRHFRWKIADFHNPPWDTIWFCIRTDCYRFQHRLAQPSRSGHLHSSGRDHLHAQPRVWPEHECRFLPSPAPGRRSLRVWPWAVEQISDRSCWPASVPVLGSPGVHHLRSPLQRHRGPRLAEPVQRKHCWQHKRFTREPPLYRLQASRKSLALNSHTSYSIDHRQNFLQGQFHVKLLQKYL